MSLKATTQPGAATQAFWTEMLNNVITARAVRMSDLEKNIKRRPTLILLATVPGLSICAVAAGFLWKWNATGAWWGTPGPDGAVILMLNFLM